MVSTLEQMQIKSQMGQGQVEIQNKMGQDQVENEFSDIRNKDDIFYSKIVLNVRNYPFNLKKKSFSKTDMNFKYYKILF